jgi:hypothetical protein
MKYSLLEAFRSLYKLFRFVFWYAIGVVALVYVLPKIARFLQAEYEMLDSTVRISLLAVSVLLIVLGLIKAMRRRNVSAQEVPVRPHSQTNTET